jgi:hypothetical protein
VGVRTPLLERQPQPREEGPQQRKDVRPVRKQQLPEKSKTPRQKEKKKKKKRDFLFAGEGGNKESSQREEPDSASADITQELQAAPYGKDPPAGPPPMDPHLVSSPLLMSSDTGDQYCQHNTYRVLSC